MKTLLLITLTFCLTMTSVKAQNPDFLFMVENAIKAPSGHNTQPWLFKINENSIEIHPNLKNSLSAVDPNNRELFISLGCCTENLSIAAREKGFDTDVSISEAGVITIALNPAESLQPNPLFNYIDERQSNRSVYFGKIISAYTIALLCATPTDPGVRMHLWANGTPEFESIVGCVAQANEIQMNDQAFKDELKSWLRYNKRDDLVHMNGLSYSSFGAPNLPKFIAKPIISNALNAKSQNKADSKKIASSSHFVLFTIEAGSIEHWITLGRNLERFLLQSTGLGIANAHCNQPCEIVEISRQMAESLHISNEIPSILLRIGYANKMPYSKRIPIKVKTV